MLWWLSKRTWTRWPNGAWHCWYFVQERHTWWETIIWLPWRPIP